MGFQIIERVCKLALSPSFGGSKEAILGGVIDYFNGLLLTYDPVLDGILVAYDSLRLVDPDSSTEWDSGESHPAAKLRPDLPLLHIKVSARFLVLSVRVDDVVIATANKMTSGHIGLLLYNNFNVSIQRMDIPASYFFIEDDTEYGDAVDSPASEREVQGSWVDSGATKTSIEINTPTSVQITAIKRRDGAIHFNARILSSEDLADATNAMNKKNYELYATYADTPPHTGSKRIQKEETLAGTKDHAAGRSKKHKKENK